MKTEINDFLDFLENEWSLNLVYDHSDLVDSYLKSINSEPQIEARSVKENEQTKEVCPLCQSDDTFSIELVHTKCRSCSCQWTN